MANVNKPELKTGLWMVRIQYICGDNPDFSSLGGQRYLGPWKWCPEEYAEAIMEATKNYGGRPEVIDRTFMPIEKVPTFEERLQDFKTFLDKPGSWPSKEDYED